MFYLLLIGIALAFAVGMKLTRGNKLNNAPPKPLAETALLRKLTLRASGDKAMVERLIALEQKRQPNATRRSLIVAALERWERDNR